MQSDGMVGMVLQPSGHPPHIKHATHLYTYEVNRESGISIKWLGGPNHILQHVICEKPTQNPTTLSRVMVWFGAVAL